MPEARAALLALALGAALLWARGAAPAQVRGSVVNATAGAPAPGVALTLSSFADGMKPVEETVSAADGTFAFAESLPAPAAGQPFAGAVRAEFDGIGYTELVRSGSTGEEVRITVYTATAAGLPAPANRVVILEPQGDRMHVREGYQFLNESDPPVTFSSEAGTLRFHLPSGADGEVDVSGTGPAGMPLRSTALPAGEQGIYKVDFPLKPGENRLDLSYDAPYDEGAEFTVRTLYSGVMSRVAVPEAVSVKGDGVEELGREPTMRVSIYRLPDKPEVRLTVTGQGRLPAEGGSAGSSRGAEISIQPAPIHGELYWIIALTVLILGLGFVHLMGSRRPDGAGEG